MAEANASRSVEKQIGNEQIAEPSTNGSQFVDLFVRCERVEVASAGIVKRECARPGEIRPAEVEFQTADGGSPLPIVAKLEAKNTALWIHTGWKKEIIGRTAHNRSVVAFRD